MKPLKESLMAGILVVGAFLAFPASSKAQQQQQQVGGSPRLLNAPAPRDRKSIHSPLPLRTGLPDRILQAGPTKESWEFMLSLPAWMVGIAGSLGRHDAPSHMNLGPETILEDLDMAASLSVAARKGRFGVYGDFFYLSDSDGIGGIGKNGLISKFDMRGDQYIADFEANSRILQGPRGWLEVRAGVRYMNVYERLILHPNEVGIERVSALLAVAPSQLVPKGMNQLISREVSALRIPLPTKEQKTNLLSSILSAKADPELAAAIQSRNPSRIAAELARVRKNIAGILARALNHSESPAGDWLDPYAGLACRYNFSKAFYFTAKGDIGGFGVGSKLTSQDYAAVGCQISRNSFVEIGYRYLLVNYQQNDFTFNVTEQGAQVTVGVNF